ncbi:MAG: TIGR00341 family protein [Methanomicrobiales archaeon]|nr:TIGR00341 family protein [Methanomicrobiales archaeon]NYT21237.1 TIGR00341 family protein [Methanomicrobiales archaeon]
MKRVIVICRTEDSPNISSLVKDITYMRSEYAKLTRFSILVPDEDLDNFISKIQQSLEFMDKSTIVEVFSPDFVISPALNGTIQEERKKRKIERSPVEKLIESAEDSADISRDTLALAAIASMVALIGLFLNNVGIIIGAMLLAPLLGPIYAFAITTTTGNRHLVVTCLRTILIFLTAIILIAFVTTFILSMVFDLPLTSEILSRTTPAPIYIIMAILLGFAIILALSTGIPESVAGVAVAAALLPPAAVVGISLALYPSGAFGALVLTMENVAGLMAGSVVGAMALQVTPRSYREKMNARTMLYRILWMLIVLIILLVFLSILPL